MQIQVERNMSCLMNQEKSKKENEMPPARYNPDPLKFTDQGEITHGG